MTRDRHHLALEIRRQHRTGSDFEPVERVVDHELTNFGGIERIVGRPHE